MPFVSICIPSYVTNAKRAETLRLCVLSALSQDFDDFEIIVGSNASSFDIHPWLEDLKDKRLKIIYETSYYPMTKNVNRTISYAKADIIKPLCDDDCIASDFLRKTVPLVKNLGFVVTGVCYDIKDLGKIDSDDYQFHKGELAIDYCPCPLSAQIFNRDVYDKIGGYDNNMYHFDYDFAFLSYFYFGGYFLSERLLYFRRWEQSSSTNNQNIYKHYSEAADTHAKLIGRDSLSKALRKACIKNIFFASATLLKKPSRLIYPDIRFEYLQSIKKNLQNLRNL